jgi:hypothetical protein
MEMKAMLLTLAACAAAPGQSLPKPAEFHETAPRPAGKSPWHCLQRLGEMEVNLVIRLSSVGIRSPDVSGKNKSRPRVKAARQRRPVEAAMEPVRSR